MIVLFVPNGIDSSRIADLGERIAGDLGKYGPTLLKPSDHEISLISYSTVSEIIT